MWLFSLYLSLFWELRDKRNLKNLQFWPESLGAMLEYWYIERGLLALWAKYIDTVIKILLLFIIIINGGLFFFSYVQLSFTGRLFAFQHLGMVQYFSQVLQELFMTWLKILSWLSSLMHLSKKKVGINVTLCSLSTIINLIS